MSKTKIILNLLVIPITILLCNIESKPLFLFICFLFILVINYVNDKENKVKKYKNCKHQNIDLQDGLSECLDCGRRNF